MSEFRKGDVCSLEVTVDIVTPNGRVAEVRNDYSKLTVDTSDLTLIRRAPVDLATCELPVEVRFENDKTGTALARDGFILWAKWPEGGYSSAHHSRFRPLDAPAPAPTLEGIKSDLVSQQKIFDPRIEKAIFDNLDTLYEDAPAPAPDQSAEIERLRALLVKSEKGWTNAIEQNLLSNRGYGGATIIRDEIHEALASTAPACAEKEYNAKLRQQIEDSMDDWSKALGWGLTGSQPECWASMDHTVKRHVELRALVRWAHDKLREINPSNYTHDDVCELNDASVEVILGLAKDLGETHGNPALVAASGPFPTCPPGHIMIGNTAVPEPMREAPEIGAQYWVASPLNSLLAVTLTWKGDSHDHMYLARGLIHSTEAAARTHSEAIVALSAKREG